MKQTYLSNLLTFIHFLNQHPVSYARERKVYPISRLLGLIWSVTEKFDQFCHAIETLLIERCYNDEIVQMQILKARGAPSDCLFERVSTWTSETKLTLNITYYLVFTNVRIILQEPKSLLISDKKQKNIFLKVLIVEVRNSKNLKDYLVRATLPKVTMLGVLNNIWRVLVKFLIVKAATFIILFFVNNYLYLLFILIATIIFLTTTVSLQLFT